MRVFCSIEQAMAAISIDAAHYGVRNPVPIPTSYLSAINDPIHGHAWQEAHGKELNNLYANRTWEEVETPEEYVNIVSYRWVWAVKYAITQEVERYKARLVA